MRLQRLPILFVATVLALTLPARATSVDVIVAAAEKQSRVEIPLRAEIAAKIDGVEGKKEETIRLFLRGFPEGSGAQILMVLEKAKIRYLVHSDGSAWSAQGGSVKKIGLDTTIAGTGWTVEDLLPFDAKRCGVVRNVDDSPVQITLLCNPTKGAEGQYALTVFKFDREKSVPIRTLYYQERQDNLVKMLRRDDYSAVGDKWLPGKLVMQNFKLNTRDVFEATWSLAADLPSEAFDPKAFAGFSPAAVSASK